MQPPPELCRSTLPRTSCTAASRVERSQGRPSGYSSSFAGALYHYAILPRMRALISLAVLSVLALPFNALPQSAKRSINLDDLARLKDVADPQCSPDGNWVVYTVATIDREADKRITNLWMVSWDGKEQVQLTQDSESASSPRWSPDGRYISFVSSR